MKKKSSSTSRKRVGVTKLPPWQADVNHLIGRITELQFSIEGVNESIESLRRLASKESIGLAVETYCAASVRRANSILDEVRTWQKASIQSVDHSPKRRRRGSVK